VIVLLGTLVLLSFGGWGLTLLRQEFDPVWFLPPESYIAKYFSSSRKYYPSDGESGTIYFNNVNYSSNLDVVANLVRRLEDEDIIKKVDAWYPYFENYANTHFNTSMSFKLSEKDSPFLIVLLYYQAYLVRN
jgi:hypothetical protein